ncbi:glycoside hydrolase family 97 catalytic domain-containing protein [Echinicola jeungdonensis]|uniref:Glycoside hydrolase family 97 catalytic domain-containing protein n=1 Tax=Echinicola jeungdonensis TaxID=709343 RepID=A0ABV5JB58_9BACT|nr:glycoside hydrolase family 97 protein [Echinicola jeungdonensis]MDN3670399.1 glycoside hydrolase family 97 catalytic domain-containing protein [Echinicola jeungdonensis]
MLSNYLKTYKMVRTGMVILFALVSFFATAQKFSITSPNQKIKVRIFQHLNGGEGSWYLKVNYQVNDQFIEIIPQIDLGLKRSDQDFSKDLKLIKKSAIHTIKEDYNAIHGKRLHRTNSANEGIVFFENAEGAKMNVVIRAYDDGVAFQYDFPDKEGTFVVMEELTSYTIPDSTTRWLEKFNPANEGYYRKMKDGQLQQDWAYPALFQTTDSTAYYLIHEAGLGRSYCGTKLSNQARGNQYKLTFPDEWNGRGQGDREPTVTLPWKSPWRVIVIGSLADIVESTLVDDVSPPSVVQKTDWIQPGKVSWNYWSHNHGTKDYKVVCDFADLAARMEWPYTLLDWEWDAMGNGGKLEDALNYIHSLGVKPLIWYNSGGDHTWVEATPKDRMLTHENRAKEFSKLKEMGIVGVKVDFFESEKQDMINYYLDIIEDAAEHEIMVYFHGCLVPRGWGRTYPHLMTYEGVRGAEWYNNVPDFTYEAPEHNTILPFTRNVVGSMDYTPITFTNSQHPHITSYGHELALGVLFESALQHMADRPDGYDELPDAAKTLLMDLPVVWDETKLLDGYPGRDVIMARERGGVWYIGGINAENREKRKNIDLDFLPNGISYKLTLIADGDHDKALSTQYMVVEHADKIQVKMLPRGGFTALLKPLN